MITILNKYKLPTDETVIANMSKYKWKQITKAAIRQHAFEDLVQKHSTLKNTPIKTYGKFEQQEYFKYLSPQDARICFKVRSGVFDVKCNRSYMYDDTLCRICKCGEESILHIINECVAIEGMQQNYIPSIENFSREEIESMVQKLKLFQVKLEATVLDQEL